jgi:peroxiredoxin
MAARLAPLALASVIALLAGCEAAPPPPQSGSPAPPFAVEGLTGSLGRFPEDYRGRVVALRFWADWCPFCKTEMQDIEPVYRRLRDSGLSILAVNVGQSREVAERFVAPLGISYGVALDREAQVARGYGVTGLPLTWLVDRQGRVRNKILGEATPEAFESLVLPLLKEPPP